MQATFKQIITRDLERCYEIISFTNVPTKGSVPKQYLLNNHVILAESPTLIRVRIKTETEDCLYGVGNILTIPQFETLKTTILIVNANLKKLDNLGKAMIETWHETITVGGNNLNE